MNPDLLTIVEAYQKAETFRLVQARAEEVAIATAKQALVDHAAAALLAITTELATAFDRAQTSILAPKYRPKHALMEHVFRHTHRTYWSHSDHTIMLEISTSYDGERLTFNGKSGTPSYCKHIGLEPITTHDQTEFKVWLASFLGLHIARYCA